MMKQQSPEFILGYLFNSIERKIVKDITKHNPYSHNPPNTFSENIPLLWFGVKNANSKFCSKIELLDSMTLAEDICKKLDNTLMDAFTKHVSHTVAIKDEQYIRFITTIVEDRRKLTISQIENILGYKITIVPEETK